LGALSRYQVLGFFLKATTCKFFYFGFFSSFFGKYRRLCLRKQGGVILTRSLFIIYFVALFGLTSCESGSDSSESPDITITVSNADQKTTTGEKFDLPIEFEVYDRSTKSKVAGAKVVVESLTDHEGSSIITNPILTTSELGMAKTVAIGGKEPGFESTFFVYIEGLRSKGVNFSLYTNAMEPGADDGASQEEEDGGGTQGAASTPNEGDMNDQEKDGENVADSTGGGSDSEEQQDVDLAKYVVVTEHNNREKVDEPFGVEVRAVNKDGEIIRSFSAKKLHLLKFYMVSKVPADSSGQVVEVSDLIPFEPVVPQNVKRKFVDGIATVPSAEGYLIKKTVPNLVIRVEDEKGMTGDSEIIDLELGPVDRLEIAAAESIPGVVEIGEKIAGENFVKDQNLDILVPSTTAEEITSYPPFTVLSGTSLTLESKAFDQYGNLYTDPVPVYWSAHDVSNTVATFPETPIFSKYLALKTNVSTMNLFVPNEEALGYIKTRFVELDDAGNERSVEDTTGVIKVTEGKPTTLFAEFYEPTLDGTIPISPAISTFVAGQPVWIKLKAGNSLGVMDTSWTGEMDISFSITGANENPGWPLPEDATPENPTTGILKPQFAGKSAIVPNLSGDLVPRLYTIPVNFLNGEAWVRLTDEVTSAQAIDDRPFAELTFVKAHEKPFFQMFDLDNGLTGSKIIDKISSANLDHARIVFFENYAVPSGYESIYPDGIMKGDMVRDFAIRVGDVLPLQSIGYDHLGNEVGQVLSSWSGDEGLPNYFLSVVADSGVNFLSPQDLLPSGKVKVTLVDNPSISATTGNVVVGPGIPDRFEVMPVGQVTAGSSFDLAIRALDKAGNIVTGYDTSSSGPISLRVFLSSQDLVPPEDFFANAAEHLTYTTLMDEYRLGKTIDFDFNLGEASLSASDAAAFKFFFTSEAPVIQVETLDLNIDGTSNPIQILPAPLASVEANFLEDISFDIGGTLYDYSLGDRVNDVVIAAGQRLKMEAVGYDRYSNLIGTLPVDWSNSATDDAGGNITSDYNGDERNFFLVSNSSVTIFSPVKSGFSYIRYETVSGYCATTDVCEDTNPVVGYTGLVDSRVGKPVYVAVARMEEPLNPSITAGVPFSLNAV